MKKKKNHNHDRYICLDGYVKAQFIILFFVSSAGRNRIKRMCRSGSFILLITKSTEIASLFS